MQIEREQLLHHLQAVQPGLKKKEENAQSSCFVFQHGRVTTFNTEVYCQMETGLAADFRMAVPAEPLLKLLEQLPDSLLDMEVVESSSGEPSEVRFTGKTKRRRAGIVLEAGIDLDISAVDTPKQWRPLPLTEFTEAAGLVAECSSTNDANFQLTCIHFHSDYIEACDNFQLIRYKLDLGVKESFLIRRESLKHILTLGMTEIGETDAWVHFRNPIGLTLSSRRYILQFPDLAPILDVEGEPLTLPDNLGKAVHRAAIFSKQAVVDTKVMVELKPRELRVEGRGAWGWLDETMKLSSYGGTPLAFLIEPNLLIEISKRGNQCSISPDKLVVDGEDKKYRYVSGLVPVKEASAAKSKAKNQPSGAAK